MKAAVYERYGPPSVLQIKTDLPRPTPKANEILVRVRATTVTRGDTRMRGFDVPRAQWIPARLYLGIRKPRRAILGMELAGDVEAVGADVTRFKPGDAVFASTFATGFGGYAEYKCLPEDGILALKPETVSYEEAAAVPVGGLTALRFLREANIQRGHAVLIYGASGSVGTFAVQLAKHHFDAHVTAVCSTPNLELVQALGADEVIDYTREDFTQRPARYDVVFDAVGVLPRAKQKAALKPSGAFTSVHGPSGGEKSADLRLFTELLAAGTVRSFIDRTYPLEQVAEAHAYVDSGHKRGNVAITVTD